MSKEEAIKLIKWECPHGMNRMFSVFFEPDSTGEYLDVGMSFQIVSVNRQTGEVKFMLDPEPECQENARIK